MERSTWVEVSKAALEANFRHVSEFAQVPVCAVVKANGYGHGLVGSAQIFAGAGAAMIAVTRVEEAADIEKARINVPLLVLSPVPDLSEAVARGWRITVASVDEIAELPKTARVHLKVDTGMGRLGVAISEAAQAATAIAERAQLEAIWTHMALPSAGQLRRFLELRDGLRSAGVDCKFHAANSAALLALRDSRLDMVRIGTLLFGENLGGVSTPFPLRDGFAWYARVASVREVGTGESVGYGGEWTAKAKARVATLPVGYADGITVQPLSRRESIGEAIRMAGGIALLAMGRRPSQRVVYFGEKAAPIIGRVAMQSISVSLDGLSDVRVGSIGRIPARRLLVNPAIERVYS